MDGTKWTTADDSHVNLGTSKALFNVRNYSNFNV